VAVADVAVTVTVDVPAGVPETPGFGVVVAWPPHPFSRRIRIKARKAKLARALRLLLRAAIITIPKMPMPLNGSHAA
jgi:hypothetical protein